MKLLWVSWMLLLFGVNLNFGHYLPRIEDRDSTVYRVKEDPSGVTIVNPKPVKPTLREVLYYHIIERPYGKQEPAVTERSFTNSHGLQFLRDSDDVPSNESSERDDENEDKEYKEVHNNNEENEELNHENELEDENQEVEEIDEDIESTTEPKPLTDEDVKEAYKARSYLFDQMRQRYSPAERMISPESTMRRKRDAEFELSSESSPNDGYIQPKTYGMNLNPDGGYVWNNLNNPPVYYDVGQSPAGNSNEAQNVYQSQESQTQLPVSNEPPQVTENNDSGSLEDIYVSTDRQPVQTLSNQGIDSAEQKEPEKPEEIKEESEEPADNPIAPIVNENSESSEGESDKVPVEPVLNDDSAPNDFNPGVEGPKFDNPEIPADSAESGEPQYEKPAEDSDLDKEGSTESSEGDTIKVIPEAPTLPPLNYDNLPDYIRDAISSTEKSESYEQTENPYVNPQLDPEDKKTVEDKMEDVFATAQPVEDIPKTYGMNLTSDSGHVWNDLVNPPVSYDVGSTEEPKAPETSEEPNQESEEESKPVEEPALPEKEAESENEPANPEDDKEAAVVEPVPENNSETDDKPAEPVQSETEAPAVSIEPIEPIPDVPENPEVNIPEPDSSESGEVPKPDDGASAETGDQPAEPKPEEDTDKKPDIMSELLKSEQFWKWLGEWTATYMEVLEKHIRKIAIQEICNHEKTGSQMCLLDDLPEDTVPIIKDGKIIIDGEEIPITHTNNLDNELKRGYKDNKDKGNKIDANTIYGNTVGNGKVTNVFIFNADNAKEIIEELKPGKDNDTKVDFIIDDRNKEDIKESKVNDQIEPKIEDVSKDAVVEVSKEAEVEVSKEAEVEVSKEAEVEVSKEAEVEVSKEAEVEVSKEAEVEVSKEAEVEVSKEAEVEVSKEAVVDVSKEAEVEDKAIDKVIEEKKAVEEPPVSSELESANEELSKTRPASLEYDYDYDSD